MVADLPKPIWLVVSLLQILFAVGLVLPILLKKPKLVSISALYLALNSLAGCALFSQYAGFLGALWGAIPALVAGLIAYGRRV